VGSTRELGFAMVVMTWYNHSTYHYPIHTMSKRLIVPVLVSVAILLSVLAVIVKKQDTAVFNSPNNTETTVTPAVDFDHWKVYTNLESNFSFEYPKEYTYTQHDNDARVEFSPAQLPNIDPKNLPPDGFGNRGFFIKLRHNPQQASLESYYATQKENPFKEAAKKINHNSSAQGYTVIQFEDVPGFTTYDLTLISHGSTIIELYNHGAASDEVINHVISTLIFK